MAKLIPFVNKILVKENPKEERTPGGLYIPDTAQKKTGKGKVVSVGMMRNKDDMRMTPHVSEGDLVYFATYAGYKVEHEGEEYMVLSPDEILCSVPAK